MMINRKKERWMTILVIVGVLLVFCMVTGGLAIELRKQLRSQIISRDGETLMAVASAEMDDVRELNEGIFDAGADEELFEVALNTSDIQGVIGVRVFKGENVSLGGIPIYIKRGQLTPEDEAVLNNKSPISRFYPALRIEDIFLLIEEEGGEPEFAVLEITIPLFSVSDESVSGYAQYYIDGRELANELNLLDRNVVTYAGGALFLGVLVGGGILSWAFRRLRLVNDLLEDRTKHLISANHKLSMEARTAAIGAITSHLIHGLKGPLQGIRQFVTAHSQDKDGAYGEAIWQDAAETTERMQSLINEVIEVLQDRGEGFSYDVNCSEIGNLVEERVKHYAIEKRVSYRMEEQGDVGVASVPNDRANLVVLILVNLVRNAIDASSRGGMVMLHIEEENDGLVFLVIDQGKGLSADVAEHIFQPVHSSKTEGRGMGLSLCQELTRHLKGELTLEKTGPQGTVFKLKLIS
jgi:signal transduction histidine kinase